FAWEDDLPLLPLAAKYTAAASTTTIPTTTPTLAHLCWLFRSEVSPTARSRTNRTASEAPAAVAEISCLRSADARASRASISACRATAAGTSPELSSHSSVMGGAIVPSPSAGSSPAVTGPRPVAPPKAKTTPTATPLIRIGGLQPWTPPSPSPATKGGDPGDPVTQYATHAKARVPVGTGCVLCHRISGAHLCAS